MNIGKTGGMGERLTAEFLRKNGFETCGTIRLVGGIEDGKLRIALEKPVER